MPLLLVGDIMACSNPLVAVEYLGAHTEKGKSVIKVLKRPFGMDFNTFYKQCSDKYSRVLALPCGQCLSCRLAKSKEWAVRVTHEASMHEENCWITLTYDPEHLPKGSTLVKKDLQDFIKRLRARIAPVRIRFFACGEYGSKTLRPHYHVCIFGYDFPDKRISGVTQSGYPSYMSDMLTDLWGKGRCIVAELTWESAAYTARYSLKKVGAPTDYLSPWQLPPFVTMSNRPGIGAEWIRRYYNDVYPHDFCVSRDNVPCAVPRYYDKLLERENPELYGEVLCRRWDKLSERLDNYGDLVCLPYDNLKAQVVNAERRVQMLPRNFEALSDEDVKVLDELA